MQSGSAVPGDTGVWGRTSKCARPNSGFNLVLTPIPIKNNPFLKLILLEQTPLLTCFGFVTSQKWLVSRRINLRKASFLIDVGVKIPAFRRVLP